MPLSQNMSMTELSRFRTRICERKALHGVCELDERCPFSHCLSWHRRNPYEYAYRPNLCPNVVFQNENKKMRVKNYCQRGRMCMFSHTKEEQMYHVLVYKTQLCREYPLCTKHYCPFAHGLDELRNPETIEFDPVQGPEVIERQRLVHDCNKFNEIDLSEDLNGPIIIKNKEATIKNNSISIISPSNSPIHSNVSASNLTPTIESRNQNSKYSLKNKSQTSNSSTNNSPKKGGRGNGFNNKVNPNNQNRQFTNNEILKEELTPVHNTNESPVTPSTGCETPIQSQNHIVSAVFRNDTRKNFNRDFHRKEIERITCSPNPRNAFPKAVDGDDIIHARDNINIPPPPYNAIGLNFPCNEGLNNDIDSSSLLSNYDFGRFAWNSYFDRNKNLSNNRMTDFEKNKAGQQESMCGTDDYGNGTSVEQMSYLMHLQLLSLSDSSEKLLENMNNSDSDWSLSNPAFGITGIYTSQQNRDSNTCSSQCNFPADLNPNSVPLTSHQNAIRCQNEVKVTQNSQLFLSNNYFDDYGFDFINSNIPSNDKMGLRDINSPYNRSDVNNLKIDCTNDSWNLFHPSLLGSSSRDGEFWREGK